MKPLRREALKENVLLPDGTMTICSIIYSKIRCVYPDTERLTHILLNDLNGQQRVVVALLVARGLPTRRADGTHFSVLTFHRNFWSVENNKSNSFVPSERLVNSATLWLMDLSVHLNTM